MAIYPELAGKVALVTGGGVGIGEAIVRLLVANRVDVAIVGRRNREPVEQVAEQARAAGVRALALLGDVSLPEQVERVFAETEAGLGAVDILVNCAGGNRPALLADTTLADWNETIAINLTDCFLCTQRAVPGMLERRWGRIINIASVTARMPAYTVSAAYAAAKAGVLGFTRHVALELGDSGVTINATAPGLTWSPRIRANVSEQRLQEMVAHIPMGRVGETDEQAGMVVFLASNEASYVNGACMDVNGAMVMI